MFNKDIKKELEEYKNRIEELEGEIERLKDNLTVEGDVPSLFPFSGVSFTTSISIKDKVEEIAKQQKRNTKIIDLLLEKLKLRYVKKTTEDDYILGPCTEECLEKVKSNKKQNEQNKKR
jgi:Mg2+ and Co2+ transporter CorA